MAFHLGIGQVTYPPAIGRTIHSPAICQKKKVEQKEAFDLPFHSQDLMLGELA